MEIIDIIKQTVKETVTEMIEDGFFERKYNTADERTEELLSRYPLLKMSDQAFTKTVVEQIDEALKSIQDDPYYRIIPLYYFDGLTRDMIAAYLGINEKTVTRNRYALVHRLSVILFSDYVLHEIFKN